MCRKRRQFVVDFFFFNQVPLTFILHIPFLSKLRVTWGMCWDGRSCVSREEQVKDVEGQRQDQTVCEGDFWMLRTLIEEEAGVLTHLVEK